MSFVGENISTAGSHDTEVTIVSRFQSRALFCWVGMPTPWKHGSENEACALQLDLAEAVDKRGKLLWLIPAALKHLRLGRQWERNLTRFIRSHLDHDYRDCTRRNATCSLSAPSL